MSTQTLEKRFVPIVIAHASAEMLGPGTQGSPPAPLRADPGFHQPGSLRARGPRLSPCRRRCRPRRTAAPGPGSARQHHGGGGGGGSGGSVMIYGINYLARGP